MFRAAKRYSLFFAAGALILTLAGCGTFSFVPRGPANDAPPFRNGQVVDIVGKVEVDRNQITLADQNSPAVFRFVGLQPAAKKALIGLDGKFTKVRLKVVSVRTPRAYNAQFIQFSTRD